MAHEQGLDKVVTKRGEQISRDKNDKKLSPKNIEQKEAADVTIDFQRRLKEAGKYMTEFAYAIYKNEHERLTLNPIPFLKKRAIESGIGIQVLRKILHHQKLPDIPDEDIQRLPDRVIEELAKKLPIFRKVHEGNRQHAMWDVKNSAYPMYKLHGVYMAGKHYEHDVTGNTMYGYTGAAGNISEETLLMMAGLAQKQMGTSDSSWTWEGSYFDDPRDQTAIRAGVYLYKKYGTNITAETIKEAFAHAHVPLYERK